MPTVQHEFTQKMIEILNTYFPNQGSQILDSSELLQSGLTQLAQRTLTCS